MNGEPLSFKSETTFMANRSIETIWHNDRTSMAVPGPWVVRWFMFGNQVHEDTTPVFRIASNILTLRGKL